jgi:hypothetical protein
MENINLIVYSKKHIDTIRVLRGGAGGSNTSYLFLRDKKDTCDLHRERIFELQSK